MTIEEKIFQRSVPDFKKLEVYGFKKFGKSYRYEKTFMNGEFKAVILVNDDGKISGEVYDTEDDDVYLPLRVDGMEAGYVGEVRAAYENILSDIERYCCTQLPFLGAQANRLATYIRETYGDVPNFLWEKLPGYGVFRNPENDKWYALVAPLDMGKLEPKQSGTVEIINLKLPEEKIAELLTKPGFYPAYHMNKKTWISLLLDANIDDATACGYIDESHYLTIAEKKTDNATGEWIVPVNPHFYDIEAAFSKHNEAIWKQSSDIHVGDLVYMYVGAPYSAILYKCAVMEVNIPYDYADENIQIRRVMKIRLLQKYARNFLPFAKLKEYGINAVRGPRKMPLALSKKLKNH